jgi:ribonuclease HI
MEDGKLVGARTKLVCGIDDAIEAEARGLDEAIEYATLFNDRKIIIEMDNSEVVKVVQRNRYPRRYWGQIVRRSGKYIKANSNTMTLQWVRRTGNEAAHQMAKWAEIEPNRSWDDNYPSLPPHCNPCSK